LDEISPGDMLPAEVRVTLNRLCALGYVNRERINETNDHPGWFIYQLTTKALGYAEENVDRLTAVFRGDGSDRPAVQRPGISPDDDIPF
jgi:hypothetical protein